MSSDDTPTEDGTQAQPGEDRVGQGQTGGTAGQPTEAGQPSVDTRSATDILSEPAGQDVLKYVVGALAIMGVGFGLAGVLVVDQFPGGTTAGVIGLTAFGVAMFGGPIIAALFVLNGRFEVGQQASEGHLLGFVSTAVGYVVMTLLALVLFSLSDTASSVDIGEYIAPIVFGAILTGLVAAGLNWLRDRTGYAGS